MHGALNTPELECFYCQMMLCQAFITRSIPVDAAEGLDDAGLVAQQQCCGPLQLPVADVAVAAQSHFGLTGAATSIGERPLMGLINPAAMARMALGESLTNLIWAAATKLEHVKASVNWM